MEPRLRYIVFLFTIASGGAAAPYGAAAPLRRFSFHDRQWRSRGSIWSRGSIQSSHSSCRFDPRRIRASLGTANPT